MRNLPDLEPGLGFTGLALSIFPFPVDSFILMGLELSNLPMAAWVDP
jgi:hypothetical protein